MRPDTHGIVCTMVLQTAESHQVTLSRIWGNLDSKNRSIHRTIALQRDYEYASQFRNLEAVVALDTGRCPIDVASFGRSQYWPSCRRTRDSQSLEAFGSTRIAINARISVRKSRNHSLFLHSLSIISSAWPAVENHHAYYRCFLPFWNNRSHLRNTNGWLL